jgi:hypothetical protein
MSKMSRHAPRYLLVIALVTCLPALVPHTPQGSPYSSPLSIEAAGRGPHPDGVCTHMICTDRKCQSTGSFYSCTISGPDECNTVPC